MHAAHHAGTERARHGCANLAHGFAAAGPDKDALRAKPWPNIAIVSAYNDMLSAHQPYERFPALIRAAAREAGAVAQFAGGVPAMCDGVTQGTDSMELSLFSRDVIAMATAVALSHNMFDGALLLGICDKIVPGLFIGAAAFGHLPIIFVPSGPMRSGMPNPEKSRIRNLYAQGKATREELLAAESASYHDVGTCTFYGTANSNQMLMEVMGLHLPGAAFVAPNTPLRDLLTIEATRRAAASSEPAGGIPAVRRRSSTNAASSMPSSACSPPAARPITPFTWWRWRMPPASRSTGMTSTICRRWCRCWRASIPNGKADVNHFHAAGGMGFLVRELLAAGLMHGDVQDRVRHRAWPPTAASRVCRTAGSPGAMRRPRAATPMCCAARRIRSAPMAA